MEDCQYEHAAVLAEKYHDFHSLVQICELTDNLDRLDSYCEKFSEEVSLYNLKLTLYSIDCINYLY